MARSRKNRGGFLKPHIDAYIAVVKKFTVFKGRARRREFWIFVLYNLIISVLFGILSSLPIIGFLFMILSLPLSIAIFVVSFAVGVRRLHDTNRSGLMLLLSFIPLVGIILLIVFWAQEGNSGANKYGTNPKRGGGTRKPPKAKSSIRKTKRR